MRTDVAKRESEQHLFRHAAVKAITQRLFGDVVIVVPPSGAAALLIAAIATGGLIAVGCIVEVPQRARAVGVLMPAGGMLEVVAPRAGQVADTLITVGDVVEKGQVLFTIADSARQAGETVADLRLRSLRRELTLLREAHASEQEIAAQALSHLQFEVNSATQQWRTAQERMAAHGRQLSLLEKRFTRWRELLRGGHVSRDAFDLEHANILRVRAESADLKQQIAAYAGALQTLKLSHLETRKRLHLDEIQQALSEERLSRELALARHAKVQEVSAAEQGVISRVLVQPGEVVRPGQVLAGARRPGDRLQAWMYLSTATARQLRVGQAVEILLEAYPHPVYGTRSAVVSFVSGAAIMPADVRAPLLLPGPVFEVRADLADSSIDADGRRWPLLPGTSFTAEIIQRRIKLHQWLFRSLRGKAGPDDG